MKVPEMHWILTRKGVLPPLEQGAEMEASASAGLRCCLRQHMVTTLPRGALVIPRFCLWPYPQELIADLRGLGCVPINDGRATAWLWSLPDWALALEDLTPCTWTWDAYVASQYAGPVVLKGVVKSRRDQWGTHMLAEGRADSLAVMHRLLQDPVGAEGIYVRAYVPLESVWKLQDGSPARDLGGCPISVEHRVVVVDGEPVARGWYWQDVGDPPVGLVQPDPNAIPEPFLRSVIDRVADACPSARFYTLDVALTAEGRWVVVELNDGCQSGLPSGTAEAVYKALAKAPLHQEIHESP